MRMVLIAVAAALGLMGCMDDPTTPVPDASIDRIHIPVGATCEPGAYWCADYAGVCAHEVCRAQCSGVSVPRCALGAHEVYEDLGVGMQCYCAP